ncbi:hypothetical protein QUA54_04750 [Microcoleus sp. MOSTC5]|uniref:hypothetical protein n=1 Tax=Microcoleus sp. MOSTC5 TaxID=3055378 RepID=UPI002FD72486
MLLDLNPGASAPSSHVWFHVTRIRKQGRGKLNPTYSEGRAHLKIYGKIQPFL